MYDAFKISVALDKLNIKIESLYAYGQKLFVGTSTGSLLVYEVKESSDEEKPLSVDLIETSKNFSKRSIEQLNVIKEIDVLVALSDSCVNIYDLHTLALQKQLAKTRGANLFAIDTTIELSSEDGDNGIPTIVTRLSVAVRRKLLIFTWKDTEFVDNKEISIPDRIRTMVWVSSTTLCLGLANEYALLDISSGALRELFSPSSTPTNAGFSYMVVSFSAKVSKPLITKLPNNEILLAKDNVSIFVGLDGTPTRKVGIDWSGTPEEIGYSHPYLVAILPKHVEIRNIVTQSLVQTIELPQPRLINQGKSLCIANNNTVWKFTPINFENQIDQLVKKHEYQEAISLTEQIEPLHLENKDARLYQIRDLYARHLLQLKNFDGAMTIFQELETDPAEVIALYSPFTSNFLHHRSEEKDDEKKIIKDNEKSEITPQTEDEKEPIDQSALNGIEENKILEGKELKNAVSALIRFLTDRRQKISKILHHQQVHKPNDEKSLDSPSFDRTSLTNGNLDRVLELAELVDTALLKAYMMTNDALVGPLLRVHNHVNVEETEGILLERKKYKELVDLYHGKGQHRKSLELLKKLGQSSEGSMKGTLHTIIYIQRLSIEHFELILEFATWVLENDPENGMDIFIDDLPGVQNLPRDKVLNYLENLSNDLCIKYLRHIIYELGETAPDYHNQLIMIYLKKILELRDQDEECKNDKDQADINLEAINVTNDHLLRFLDESMYYKAEKILGRLPLDDFYEARAMVLCRLGRHDQALSIYVHRLKDEQLAEEYCVKNYKVTDDGTKNVFMSLLRVYLSPSNGEQVMIEPALRLLSRYGSHVNATETLNMLPATTKVSELYSFFEKYIRESNRNKSTNMVVKNLLKADQKQAEEQLMCYRSRRIKIDEDRMCPQCTRRIGNSVFAVFPNGVVVHYNCKEKYSQAHDTAI